MKMKKVPKETRPTPISERARCEGRRETVEGELHRAARHHAWAAVAHSVDL